jgi:hypothetical protein
MASPDQTVDGAGAWWDHNNRQCNKHVGSLEAMALLRIRTYNMR